MVVRKNVVGGNRVNDVIVASVDSDVPQGSILEPVLFLIDNINDLDELGVSSSILKFAEYTKMFERVGGPQEADMQRDIDRLVSWSIAWQMLFNVKKCRTMQTQRQSTQMDHVMNDAR